LSELLERVVSVRGSISSALSASEWHELQEAAEEQCAIDEQARIHTEAVNRGGSTIHLLTAEDRESLTMAREIIVDSVAPFGDTVDPRFRPRILKANNAVFVLDRLIAIDKVQP